MKQSNQQIFLRALGVSFFLVMLWSSLTLSAQQTDTYITLTTSHKEGEMIEIGFLAKDINKVSIDGIKEQPSRSGSKTPVKYTLNKQTVTIQGELTLLFVSDAMLTQLDITHMPSLETLNCARNSLTSLDLSRSVALKELHCLHNNITELKGLASAQQIKKLHCQENALSTLDLSQMTKLEHLDCSKNRIASLDLSNATAIKNLTCVENNITSLDLSQTKQLAFLDCSANKLTALDLSNLSHLNDVNCAGNQIRGKAMTQLMNRLPAPKDGGWLTLVTNSKDDEDNIATKEDVTTAITRRWKVIDDQQDDYKGVDAYAVTLVTGDGGTAKVQEDVELSKVPEGLKLTIIATPQTGFELDKIMAGSEDITMSKQFVVKQATKVQVSFKKKPVTPEPKKTFAVTLVTSDGGTAKIVGAKDLTKVTEGTQLTVIATPQTGFELDKIMAGSEDITMSKQFVVKQAIEVQVSFKKKPVTPEPKKTFAVTLVTGDGGTAKIEGAKDLTKVTEGTQLTVIATPKTGFELDKIMAGSEDITTSKQFVVKQATKVQVSFKKSTAITDVASAQLQIYPNPTAQELHIAGVAPHLPLTLYNVAGEASAVARSDSQGVAEMDLSHLPAGLYLLQISGELHRIVLQNR